MGMKKLRFIDDEVILQILQDLRSIEKKAAIEIYCNGKTALQFIPGAMSPDKQNWLRRKRNTVLHFGMSTMEFHKKIQGDASLISEKYGLDASAYTVVPGAIPLEMEYGGVVGCLAITGLSPEEDHALAERLLQNAIERQYE